MSWLFSQALVAEFSADTCSAGEPSAQLSANPTQQAYCSPDRMTAYSRLSRFGMTFKPLTDDRGAELLMSYRAGFRARTSAPQAKAQESREPGPASGRTWRGLLARFDPATSSWRTVQPSLFGDSDECSVTWPRSGMTADGRCWELPMSAHRINGTGFGLWPTPTVCGNYNRKGASATSGDGLATAVRMWPTPQASDNRNRGTASTPAIARRIEAGKQVMLSMTQDGPLNPTFVEWLMGFPLGWTDLRPLEMRKFLEWQQQHSMNSLREAA